MFTCGDCPCKKPQESEELPAIPIVNWYAASPDGLCVYEAALTTPKTDDLFLTSTI